MKITLWDEFSQEYQRDIMEANDDELFQLVTNRTYHEQVKLLQELIEKIKEKKIKKIIRKRKKGKLSYVDWGKPTEMKVWGRPFTWQNHDWQDVVRELDIQRRMYFVDDGLYREWCGREIDPKGRVLNKKEYDGPYVQIGLIRNKKGGW